MLNTFKKNTQTLYVSLLVGVLALPTLASAQIANGNAGKIGDYSNQVLNFINGTVVPFFFAVALLLFIYGVYVYLIQSGSDPEKREEGRRYAFWAIMALVIIISVWGITNLVATGLGLSGQDIPANKIPDVPVSGS